MRLSSYRTSKNNRVEVATATPAQLVALVKKTFPEDPITACAVAYGESLNNPKGINKSQIEHSVGIMQINLMRHSDGKKIHWSKVPGETLQEKEAWLQVPENNLKVAREIYEGRNKSKMHFGDWSAFTNGSYKRHLSKCQ